MNETKETVTVIDYFVSIPHAKFRCVRTQTKIYTRNKRTSSCGKVEFYFAKAGAKNK